MDSHSGYSFNIRVPQQATQFFFKIAELIIIMNYMDTVKVHILWWLPIRHTNFSLCQCSLLISAFPPPDLPVSQKLKQIVNVFESHQPITSH